MIIKSEEKPYQKLLKSKSVLQGLRKTRGIGRGLIAGGLTLLGFGLLLLLLFWWMDRTSIGVFFLILCGLPGVPMLAAGFLLRQKRNSSYLSFYQKSTGFDEAELRQVERELASPSVHIIGDSQDFGGKGNPVVACILTEHYFVTAEYVRRLEDMIAAAFSDNVQLPHVQVVQRRGMGIVFGLLLLAKTDEDAWFVTFNTAESNKKALCTEIVQALSLRNPAVLKTQHLVCEGRKYDLKKNGKELLRLYKEGHTIEEAR